MILHAHTPRDVEAASEEWNATCGPCALAAALGVDVKHVREAVSSPVVGELPGLPSAFRGWMTIGQMKAAIAALGCDVATSYVSPDPVWLFTAMTRRDHGSVLACLQWGGPWGGRAAATHRHWVVFRHVTGGEYEGFWIYDWNAHHRVTIHTYDGVTPHVEGTRWCEKEMVRRGGWLRFESWERVVLPGMLPKRGDGTWKIQWAGGLL